MFFPNEYFTLFYTTTFQGIKKETQSIRLFKHYKVDGLIFNALAHAALFPRSDDIKSATAAG